MSCSYLKKDWHLILFRVPHLEHPYTSFMLIFRNILYMCYLSCVHMMRSKLIHVLYTIYNVFIDNLQILALIAVG